MNSPEKPERISDPDGTAKALLLRLMPERRTAMMNMPVINMTATGQNIVRLRKEAGLSVRELQDIFGFTTPQAIYKWQHGTSMPTIDNLVVLAVVFHVQLEEILVLDDVQPENEVVDNVTFRFGI